jgi:hypothetical protein
MAGRVMELELLPPHVFLNASQFFEEFCFFGVDFVLVPIGRQNLIVRNFCFKNIWPQKSKTQGKRYGKQSFQAYFNLNY